MKRIVTAALCLALALALAGCGGSKDELVLTLGGDAASTGHSWRYTLDTPDVVAVSEKKQSDGTTEVLTPVAEGSTTIKLEYAADWAKVPSRTVVISAHVNADGSMHYVQESEAEYGGIRAYFAFQEQTASTGYTWSAVVEDDHVLTLNDSGTTAGLCGSADGSLSCSMQYYEYYAIAPNAETLVTFTYARSWESTPARTVIYRVTTTAASEIEGYELVSDIAADPEAEPSATPTGGAQLPNPLRETTEQELEAELGFPMAAPENAADAAWYVISDEIGQLTFTLDGASWCLRIAVREGPKSLDTALAESFAGVYRAEWQHNQTEIVYGTEAQAFWQQDAEGVMVWYDYEKGWMFSLSTDKGASEQTLLGVAEGLYTYALERRVY